MFQKSHNFHFCFQNCLSWISDLLEWWTKWSVRGAKLDRGTTPSAGETPWRLISTNLENQYLHNLCFFIEIIGREMGVDGEVFLNMAPRYLISESLRTNTNSLLGWYTQEKVLMNRDVV